MEVEHKVKKLEVINDPEIKKYLRKNLIKQFDEMALKEEKDILFFADDEMKHKYLQCSFPIDESKTPSFNNGDDVIENVYLDLKKNIMKEFKDNRLCRFVIRIVYHQNTIIIFPMEINHEYKYLQVNLGVVKT
jgi:hypothetical protein